jgi:hypothetical protein
VGFCGKGRVVVTRPHFDEQWAETTAEKNSRLRLKSNKAKSTVDDIIAQIDALDAVCDNALDVIIEVALFKPTQFWAHCRANDAGTKVIYTGKDGTEDTCWADEWVRPDQRESTISLLKAIK